MTSYAGMAQSIVVAQSCGEFRSVLMWISAFSERLRLALAEGQAEKDATKRAHSTDAVSSWRGA